MHNRLEYRSLEGFVLAITPFNFTAIGGNLPTSAAMCGNTVVWKPADTQIFSAMDFYENSTGSRTYRMVLSTWFMQIGTELGEICFSHRGFCRNTFYGFNRVFNTIWKTIGENIGKYRSYPRIVGKPEERILCWCIGKPM